MPGPEGLGYNGAEFRAKKFDMPGFNPAKAGNDNNVEKVRNNVVQLRPGQEKQKNTPGILSVKDTIIIPDSNSKIKLSEANDSQKPIHQMSFTVNGSYFRDNTRINIVENSPVPDLPKGKPSSTSGHELAHAWTMFVLHGPGSVHRISNIPNYSLGYLGVTEVSHFSAPAAVAADEAGFGGAGSDLAKVDRSGQSRSGAAAIARPILEKSVEHRRVGALMLDQQGEMSGTQLPGIKIFVDTKLIEAEKRKDTADAHIKEADGSEKTIFRLPVLNGTVQIPETIYQYKPKYPQSGEAFPQKKAA